MSASEPSRGDVWSINLDPTLGREQAGTRPALVVSVDKFNHGPADLILVLPITSKDKKQPIRVQTAAEAVLRNRIGADDDRGREAYPNPSKPVKCRFGANHVSLATT